jgi:hypothetical protein
MIDPFFPVMALYHEKNNKETEHIAPNPEIGIHDFALSSHLWALRKIIIEPTGATQI